VVFLIKMFRWRSIEGIREGEAIVWREIAQMLEDSLAGKEIPHKCETKQVDENIALAQKLGITGTPTLSFRREGVPDTSGGKDPGDARRLSAQTRQEVAGVAGAATWAPAITRSATRELCDAEGEDIEERSPEATWSSFRRLLREPRDMLVMEARVGVRSAGVKDGEC